MSKDNDEEITKSLAFLLKGSVIVFAGVFLSKIFTFLYKFIIARNFGPEIYGLFLLATIIVSLFSTLASFGLSEGLLRYASLYNNPKEFKKIKPLLKYSLVCSLASGIFFATLLAIFSDLISLKFFHDPSLSVYLLYLSITIPFILISNIFLSLIKANLKVLRYTFIVNILQNSVKLIGLFFLVIFGFKGYAIIGSYLLGVVSLMLGAYIGARDYLSKIMSENEIPLIKIKVLKRAFLSYSWPIIFVGFVGAMLYWIDSLVIGSLMNAINVGLYGAAFTLVSLLGIAPELFMQLFLPLIIREYSKGRIEIIDQISKQVSKWIGVINIPAFTLMFLFPEIALKLFFGVEYEAAASSLKILALGGFFSSFITLNTSLLSMKGRSKSILTTLLLASAVNLFLDIILVKLYGMNGAAIATSSVWVLTLIAFTVQVSLSTGIFPVRRKLINIVLLSTVPAAALMVLSKYLSADISGLIVGLIIYLTIYVGIIFLSKSLDRNDVALLKKIIISIKLFKRRN